MLFCCNNHYSSYSEIIYIILTGLVKERHVNSVRDFRFSRRRLRSCSWTDVSEVCTASIVREECIKQTTANMSGYICELN
jgi:hypothetical protein